MKDSIIVPMIDESMSPKVSPTRPTLSNNNGSKIDALKLRSGAKKKSV